MRAHLRCQPHWGGDAPSFRSQEPGSGRGGTTLRPHSPLDAVLPLAASALPPLPCRCPGYLGVTAAAAALIPAHTPPGCSR